MSQLGWLFHILWKIKHVWNHQPVCHVCKCLHHTTRPKPTVKEDSEQITDFTPTSVGTSNVIQQPEAHLPPKKAMKNTTIIPLKKNWLVHRVSQFMDPQWCNDPQITILKLYSHRIHGAAIYGNMAGYQKNIPPMLAYIPALWILWDSYIC